MVESERADSLVRRSEPLRCIGDALEACSREFTSDAFWADLAKPIRKAIDKCHEQEEALAAGEAELATEARRNAVACLAHLDEQMRQASEAGLFRNEARMIKMVHETMKFDESLRLDSPLDSVAQAAHAMQTEGAQIRQGHAAKNQAKLERIRTAMKPYVFEHVSGSCEMSVKIPVPDATSARDVTCHFSREAIRVSIVGHALQPTVIHGKLQHPVDVDACAWRLEGSSSNRHLIIDLEKVSGGLDWRDLLNVSLAGEAGEVV